MARDKNITINKEEWIWVKGFKGTDKNMCCRGYQFRLNEVFNIPEDEDITLCHSGFHFCTILRDVFAYYEVEANNRFFEVSALVRKREYYEYGKFNKYFMGSNSKITSKSIIFHRELTDEEIFAVLEKSSTNFYKLPQEYRPLVREYGTKEVLHEYRTDTLVKDGYSEPFALFIADDPNKFEIAHAVATQPELSMDMKVFCIFNGKNESLNSMTFRLPNLGGLKV